MAVLGMCANFLIKSSVFAVRPIRYGRKPKQRLSETEFVDVGATKWKKRYPIGIVGNL